MTIIRLQGIPRRGKLKGLYKAEYKAYSSYGISEKEAVRDLKRMLKRRNVK